MIFSPLFVPCPPPISIKKISTEGLQSYVLMTDLEEDLFSTGRCAACWQNWQEGSFATFPCSSGSVTLATVLSGSGCSCLQLKDRNNRSEAAD